MTSVCCQRAKWVLAACGNSRGARGGPSVLTTPDSGSAFTRAINPNLRSHSSSPLPPTPLQKSHHPLPNMARIKLDSLKNPKCQTWPLGAREFCPPQLLLLSGCTRMGSTEPKLTAHTPPPSLSHSVKDRHRQPRRSLIVHTRICTSRAPLVVARAVGPSVRSHQSRTPSHAFDVRQKVASKALLDCDQHGTCRSQDVDGGGRCRARAAAARVSEGEFRVDRRALEPLGWELPGALDEETQQ